MRTPLDVTTISPGLVPSTFPPVSEARSTTTAPGDMVAIISAVTRRGAARPGTAAVVMRTSAAEI